MPRNRLVREVAARLACDEARADGICFVVLHELRERLTPKEAADLAAQLPGSLRELWLEGERPDREVSRLHAHEFVGRVRNRAVLGDDGEAERAVKAVFGTLQRLLGSPTGQEGEAWHVFSQLPKELKKLWLAAAEP